MILLATVLELIVLHTLDGRDLFVNAKHVTILGEAREPDDPQKLMTDKVHCVINMLDGTHVTVEESCDSIRKRLEGLP